VEEGAPERGNRTKKKKEELILLSIWKQQQHTTESSLAIFELVYCHRLKPSWLNWVEEHRLPLEPEQWICETKRYHREIEDTTVLESSRLYRHITTTRTDWLSTTKDLDVVPSRSNYKLREVTGMITTYSGIDHYLFQCANICWHSTEIQYQRRFEYHWINRYLLGNYYIRHTERSRLLAIDLLNWSTLETIRTTGVPLAPEEEERREYITSTGMKFARDAI
jgi:hypothetical protein